VNREQSPAWKESRRFDLLEEHIFSEPIEYFEEYKRVELEYIMNNPNSLSTPMGALCWAEHELSRASDMAVWRYTMDYEYAPYVMGKLGITIEQVGDAGPAATTALLDLLATGPEILSPRVSVEDGYEHTINMERAIETDGSQLGSVDDSEEMPRELTRSEEKILGFFGRDYVDYQRWLNALGGDGTEWENAIRAVNMPEVVAATRAGDGLPETVRQYADALFADVKELVRLNYPLVNLLEDDEISFTWRFFEHYDAFVEVAKYAQDCIRAYIYDESDTEPTTATTVPATTTPTSTTVATTGPTTTSTTVPEASVP
jgi:hypothetical protein